MSPTELIPGRHAQGLAAYRAGHGVPHLFELVNEIAEDFQRARNAELPDAELKEQYRIRDNAVPSLIAGFVDGLLGDIRSLSLASARRGRTA